MELEGHLKLRLQSFYRLLVTVVTVVTFFLRVVNTLRHILILYLTLKLLRLAALFCTFRGRFVDNFLRDLAKLGPCFIVTSPDLV